MSDMMRRATEAISWRIIYKGQTLLVIASVSILLLSFFFYNPKNDPLAIGFDSRFGQTLVYGGLVLVIALFAWRWSAAGGIIAILYGAYKIFEYIRLAALGAPLTLVPAPVYIFIYGLFVAGGILCVRIGLRTPEHLPAELEPYYWLRKSARIATAASILIAGTVSFGLGIILTMRISYYSPDFLLGGMIFLFPLLLAIAYIAWKWPAPGGLLTIVTGVPLLSGIMSSNWGLTYELPYAIFCVIFISGGILHLAGAFLKEKYERDK